MLRISQIKLCLNFSEDSNSLIINIHKNTGGIFNNVKNSYWRFGVRHNVIKHFSQPMGTYRHDIFVGSNQCGFNVLSPYDVFMEIG